MYMSRSFLFHLLVSLVFMFSLLLVAGCEGDQDFRAQRASFDHPQTEVTGSGKPEKEVFRSPLAGSWYDADPKQLASEIDGYLANVYQAKLSSVCALILPHAGLRWSGQTAAYGIEQIKDHTFHTVIVMGPSHRIAMQDTASLPSATHYATPLGETSIEVDLVRTLKKSPYFQVVPSANEEEHSVQVMLPFLQRALGPFRFVPIVLGQLDVASARAIADTLLRAMDENTLVVASTDFTHYGPRFGYVPFTGNPSDNLKKLDMGAFRFIEQKDLKGFDTYIQRTGDTICGRSAIEVLLAMLPPEARVHLLRYDTSGAMTGDFTDSVSYVSAACTGEWKKVQTTGEKTTGADLSLKDKKRLMDLAKGTLKFYLEKGKPPTPEQLGVKITPGMNQVMGAFVTLKEHGQLRGCIGEIYPVRPLYEAVMAHAIDAAVNDPRFPPVRAEDFKDLKFEISALTPPRPVKSCRDVRIGKEGIVLEKNGRSAVFLPQVAPEQGWGLEETLSHLSRKAGLPAGAWKEGAACTVFEAIVFGEGDV
jgi:AmmeMemoRadiSam system protein B/AmmeMemoRadiSam system protein A